MLAYEAARFNNKPRQIMHTILRIPIRYDLIRYNFLGTSISEITFPFSSFLCNSFIKWVIFGRKAGWIKDRNGLGKD